MKKVHNKKFLALLRSSQEQIVFLFGAGMSLALGNQAKTWPGWLKEGRKYLPSSDLAVFDAAFDESSANGLIDSAGTLLRLLKNNGAYQSFMHDTIESICPTNAPLQEVLKKLNRCGDIFATTNYDSLLEKSAEISGVTYEEPELILKILKGDMQRRVIHLHGAYANGGRTDNIVADASQYDAILDNRGAQFLQQLMGTYPIVMAGCGNTVSDPNLHGFLSFAQKYLKSGVPCFYLYKEGEDLHGVPSHCTTVCYGTKYEEFPEFLQEMAAIRINYRLESGIGQFNPYLLKRQLTTSYGRLHFMNLFSDFAGREEELQRLDEFLKAPPKYAWWTVIGSGGVGKSRLVLEWLRRLPSDWYGIFVDPEKGDKIEEFALFSNTVFVFDYIIGKEEIISRAIDALQQKAQKYKIRILFIERTCDQERLDWRHTIVTKMASAARIAFEKGTYEKGDFLLVSALKPEDENEYAADYFDRYLCQCVEENVRKKYDPQKEETIEQILLSFHKDLQEKFWTPLYLAIFLELWIYHDGCLHVRSGMEMLEKYMEKEESRWMEVLGEESLVYGYAKALTLACVLDGYCISIPYGYKNDEISALDRYVRARRSPGKKKRDWSQVFIREYGREEVNRLEFLLTPQITFMGVFDGKVFPDESVEIPEYDAYFTIEPEYPDLLKELIVSYYLSPAEVESFTKAMRKIDKGRLRSVSFLSHAMEDFPEETCFGKIMTAKPETIHEQYVFLRTLLLIGRMAWLSCMDDIASALLASQYTAYVETDAEVYLWGMLAECLIYTKDKRRMQKFSKDFFQYLNARWQTLAFNYAIPVVRAYCKGFFILKDLELLEEYAAQADQFAKPFESYPAISKRMYMIRLLPRFFLANMLFYQADLDRLEEEVKIIQEICRPQIGEKAFDVIYVEILDHLIYLWGIQLEISHPNMAHEAVLDLKRIYAIEKTEQAAAVLAQAYLIEYWKYQNKRSDVNKYQILMQFSRDVKKLLYVYPENTEILTSYLTFLCIRVDESRERYAILSAEDWKLFEKLSDKRPDCLELMVFYREGLEYRIKKAAPFSRKKAQLEEKYYGFLTKMFAVIKTMEQNKDFTFPRGYPKPPKQEEIDDMYQNLFSWFQEDFIKTEEQFSGWDPRT